VKSAVRIARDPEHSASPSTVVFGHLIIDDITLADGSRHDGVLGGAGPYAALGAAMVTADSVALVSGVGGDLTAGHRGLLAAWRIDTTALYVRGRRTPRSGVRYRSDGSRTETPVLGQHHFVSMDPTVDDLPTSWQGPAGVYFFATHVAWQWPALQEWARTRNSTLMWEISADSCRTDLFSEVGQRLRSVDMLSINLQEARALCGLQDPTECVHKLRGTGVGVVAVHMGADGAVLADSHQLITVPATPCDDVADPTGAGNSYSGALLAAWCAGRDLRFAAEQAAWAASQTLRQFGFPRPTGRAPTIPAEPPAAAARPPRTFPPTTEDPWIRTP